MRWGLGVWPVSVPTPFLTTRCTSNCRHITPRSPAAIHPRSTASVLPPMAVQSIGSRRTRASPTSATGATIPRRSAPALAGNTYTPGQTFNPGVINRYTDLSVDWQYQYNGQRNIYSFLGHVTHERQQNSNQLVAATFTGASTPIYTNPTDTLPQFLVTGEYFRNRHYGGLVSFTRTTGTSDPLANGGNGSPANQYETFELDYVPWPNVRLILQHDA